MAVDEVRYVGEAVAVVVARDRYAAADALNAIDVDYDPLPPVLDIRTALDAASPKVHEAGNKSYEWVFANGDVDGAFSDAPVVVERTFRQQRLIPCAMEPRAVVAQWIGDEVTLWSATQIPHVLRFALSAFFGIPEQDVRVIAPDVGGGFGSKLQVTAEEVLAVLIGRRVGKPVKWTESRSEGNLTVHHGRDQWQRIRIAADRDGRIRGLSMSTCWRTWAPTSCWSRPACRCSARSCTRPSTRWTPTRSSARASSPPRCRPTPTAARAVPRRRSPSSGSWTSSRPSSASSRWNCASGTGSSTRSSRSPRSAA